MKRSNPFARSLLAGLAGWLLAVAATGLSPARAQEPTPAATNSAVAAVVAPAAAVPTTTPIPTPNPGPKAPGSTSATTAGTPLPAPVTPLPSPLPASARALVPPPAGGAPGAPSAIPGGGTPPAFRSAIQPRLRPPTNAPAGPAAAVAGAPRPGGPGGPGGPAAPGAPGAAGAAGPDSGVTASAREGDGVTGLDDVLTSGDDVPIMFNLQNAPLETVLDLYADLVRRVLLRPPQLAGGPISVRLEGLSREESIEALNAVLALNSVSVIPVGEKFVKVIPSAQAATEGAKANEGQAESFSELGQFTTKMVKVTKVKPGDIAQAVQAFASGKVQNPVLVFDDQNFFILRDMAANVKRMIELIKELDVALEMDYKLEVIPIRYGKVDEIYETLNSVVTGSGGGGVGARSTRQAGFASGATGTSTTPGMTGQGGVGSQFGAPRNSSSSSSRFGSRSGSMSSPGAARSNLGDRLRAVSSAAVGGAGGGGQYNLLGESRIIPDMRSNSLLVYANKEDLAMLTNIVAKIDTLLAQVLIESIILEVSLEKGKDFGVSMTQSPQQFGNWSTAGGSVNKASIATNLVGSAFPSGFSYFGQYKDDFSMAITAIANDSRAKVLARPRIQTTHAQVATFRIGDTVPYPRSSSPYYGGGIGSSYTPYTTYDEKDVVTELTVTPYITPDGLVTLEVDQKIDQLGPTTKVGNDEVPTIRTRSATAVLSVHDREPVILGGFITDRQTDSTSGVPWLKDIPLLGWAFRSKSDFKQRSELIVLIRPTILNTPQEAAKLAELEQRSLPNAAAAVRQFQREEALMAEKLGVTPGGSNEVSTATDPVGETRPKGKGRGRNRDR